MRSTRFTGRFTGSITLLLAVAACGGDPASLDGGGDSSGSDLACINTAGPPLAAPQVVLGSNVRVTKLLTVQGSALLATSPPNDGRLFVLEQSGDIVIVQDGVEKPTPFLDLQSVVTADAPPGEPGCSGSRSIPTTRATASSSSTTRPTRRTSSRASRSARPISNKADPTSGQIILSIAGSVRATTTAG